MIVATRIPDDVVERARGADCLDVAKRFGARLKEVARNEYAGPCPACGGSDRFSVNTEKNVFHCRQSGQGGDAVALWQYVTGDRFAGAVCGLTGFDMPGMKPSDPARFVPAKQHQPPASENNPFRQKAMREAYDLWRSAHPAEEIVRAYFAARAIPFPDWRMKAIRELPNLAYWHKSETTGATAIIHRGPAMVAAITGPDGRFLGLHRTWIDFDRNGGKASIACPDTGEILASKKVLGSMRNGAIALRPAFAFSDGQPPSDASAVCVAGEGIETVISWDVLHGASSRDFALWSAVTLGNLAGKATGTVAHPTETFVTRNGQTRRRKVPGSEPDFTDDRCLAISPDFDRVILLGDGDSDPFTTRTAMRRAKARHEVAGTVAPELQSRPPIHRDVHVDFAPAGKDWNDVLMAGSPPASEAKLTGVAE